MLEDTLRGLQFIHSSGFVHRDFKSPNLLVDRNWCVKISDFGLSCLKSKSDDEAQISLLWAAPEVLNKEKDCFTEKSDIYAFGITVWELMSRQVPYANITAAAIPPAVTKGTRPPVDKEWNPAICELVDKCWTSEPRNRLTIKEARALVGGIYIDPNFEIGSSSALAKYIEKTPPPVGTITFVHTVIFNSKVWESDPRVMMRSVIIHNNIIRAQMDKLRGYEVKSNGEAFMIAFADTILAINFCLRVQTELLNADWPEILLNDSLAKREFDTIGNLIHRGLSVNMGIHITNPTHEKNPETGTMDYFGNGVTVSAKLADLGGRGHILMGPEVYSRAIANTQRLEAFDMRSLGTVRMKEDIFVYEMVPLALKERQSTRIMDSDIEWDDTQIKYNFPPPKDSWRIDYGELQIGEKIGAGSFGEVRAGTWKGKKVAVKELVKQKMTNSTAIELKAESAFLSMLQHDNILKFVGLCMKDPHLCMVTEYMEKGSLAQVLYNAVPLSWDRKSMMIKDMVKGMAFLHSKSIIHRDIKSSNMLVGANWRVKIADFGFSRMKSDNNTMTQCGTVAWTAPEIFDGGHYTEQADVYSFGVILWEMIFCTKPWANIHSMKVVQLVASGKRPAITNMPTSVPPSIVSLMESCWSQDPNSRPTFEDILVDLE